MQAINLNIVMKNDEDYITYKKLFKNNSIDFSS
jgi:hypothetical protein